MLDRSVVAFVCSSLKSPRCISAVCSSSHRRLGPQIPYLQYEYYNNHRLSEQAARASGFGRRPAEPGQAHPYDHLFRGYLQPFSDQPPGLQSRRTLDRYYYSHLEDTSQRDDDQVIYRYTAGEQLRGGKAARIFMVDQVWVWVLDKRASPPCTTSPYLKVPT
jgi:hypothetical protein